MYHANLLVGRREWAEKALDFPVSVSDPDTIVKTYERMSIDDARALIADSLRRPVSAKRRVFILYAYGILGEAQNALLKLFEEPNEYTAFYLIVPSADTLIPTLRSRCVLFATEQSSELSSAFLEFKKMSHAERLVFVAEKLKSEDGDWVKNIMNGFEMYAHNEHTRTLLEDAVMLSEYKSAPGSSKKILLEHIALSL